MLKNFSFFTLEDAVHYCYKVQQATCVSDIEKLGFKCQKALNQYKGYEQLEDYIIDHKKTTLVFTLESETDIKVVGIRYNMASNAAEYGNFVFEINFFNLYIPELAKYLKNGFNNSCRLLQGAELLQIYSDSSEISHFKEEKQLEDYPGCGAYCYRFFVAYRHFKNEYYSIIIGDGGNGSSYLVGANFCNEYQYEPKEEEI